MQKSKVGLDFVEVEHARSVAKKIAGQVQDFVDDYTTVAGYDPDRYLQIYDDAEGYGSQQKINAMRREFYAENRERISAQKRDAYARRRALESSAAEELDT